MILHDHCFPQLLYSTKSIVLYLMTTHGIGQRLHFAHVCLPPGQHLVEVEMSGCFTRV